MKICRLLICILILVFPGIVKGQDDDFGIWYGLSTEHILIKKLEIKASSALRTFNNASEIYETYIEGGASYKFNKYFSGAGSYRLTLRQEDDSEFHIRNKWFAEFKSTLPLGNFSFSARFMLQIMTRRYIESEKDKNPDYNGRIKLKLLYKIPKFPIDPYLSFETFSPLFDDSSHYIEKERFTAGFAYNIAKKHAIETEYILQRDLTPHISDIHIISINYKFEF